jgi:hypothetical protein
VLENVVSALINALIGNNACEMHGYIPGSECDAWNKC